MADIHPSYAQFVAEIAELSPDRYYETVFSYSEDHYRERVDMAGFAGHDRVLDVGCGYGQWAAALARVNRHVTGIDMNPRMVEISQRYARHFDVANAEFGLQTLPRLDFADAEFDLIWCWSVFMFIDRSAALREFHRLLRPGGRLLIGCCNGRGRWLYKIAQGLRQRPRNDALIGVSARTLWRGAGDTAVPNYTSMRGAAGLLERHGFTPLAVDYDGCIDVRGRGRRLPMFAPRFLGFEQNIEFIGERR